MVVYVYVIKYANVSKDNFRVISNDTHTHTETEGRAKREPRARSGVTRFT